MMVANRAIQLTGGKLGSKQLREKLPGMRTVVEQLLRKSRDARLCVCCSTGKDLSVGAVLMILCCFYADDGRPTLPAFIVTLLIFRRLCQPVPEPRG